MVELESLLKPIYILANALIVTIYSGYKHIYNQPFNLNNSKLI